MSSKGNNTNWIKQLSHYGKIKKPRIKEFTNAKLTELPFFEKPIKIKIKQLSIKKLLSEKHFSKKQRTFKTYTESYKVEIINNKSLSDFLSVSKNSMKIYLMTY